MIRLFFFLLSFSPLLVCAQFTENFENFDPTTSGWIVNNWSISDYNNNYKVAQDGTKCITPSSSTNIAHLISPPITVIGGVSDQFSFWVKSGMWSNYNALELKLSNTTSSISDFTTTITTILPSGGIFTKYTFDLSPYIGQTIYLLFRNSTPSTESHYLDKIVLGSNSTCLEPTEYPIFENITNSSVQVSWPPASNINDGYEIYYSSSPAAPDTNIMPNTNVPAGVTSAILTNLNSGVKYHVYIRSKCGANKSPWGVKGAFYTDFTLTPPYFSSFEDEAINDKDTVPIGWTTSPSLFPFSLRKEPGKAYNGERYLSSADQTFSQSPRFSLTAGTTYRVSIFAKRTSAAMRNHSAWVSYSTASIGPKTTIFSFENNTDTYTKYTGTFTPTTSGAHYINISASISIINSPVPITYSGIFIDDFSVEIENALSTNETSKPKTTISPNPAKDILNINSSNTILEINVLTSDARLIKTYKVNSKNTQINISDLPSGIYFFNLKSTKDTESHKIIKE